jgi:hypothetical protein
MKMPRTSAADGRVREKKAMGKNLLSRIVPAIEKNGY